MIRMKKKLSSIGPDDQQAMSQMKQIRQAVYRLGGRQHKDCYATLCYAVYAVNRYQPELPQMKTVWMDVLHLSRQPSPEAVSRALARAADDVWQNGNRATLADMFCGQLREKPTPKALIYAIAQQLWQEAV